MSFKNPKGKTTLASLAFASVFMRLISPMNRGNKKANQRRRGWSSPHIGAKEHERAKRCYMVTTFGGLANPGNKNPRTVPTLGQASKSLVNYPF